MDQINSKITATQDETRFTTQNVGMYGYDATTSKWRRLTCDADGKLNIEATLELDSSTLAKEVTLTDGTQQAKVMGSEDGATTGTQRQLKVDSTGALHIISENADSMLIKGIETGTSTQRDCKQNANGDLRTQLIGNDGVDGAGTMRIVKCDADGILEVNGSVSISGGATEAKQDTQITNQGDTNSKIDAMRASDSLTTVKDGIVQNLTDGSTKAKIMGLFGGGQYQVATDAAGHLQIDLLTNADTTKATSTLQTAGNASLTSVDGKITACNTGAVSVASSALPTGAATETTLAAVEAHQGNIENNLSSIQSTVSANKLQVDVITSALPTGAATETTLAAAEAHLGTIDTSTASVAGCVSGTEVQVDVRNRTDSSPNALTFTAGNTIVAASGVTSTAAIDVTGCSNYSIMLNMLTATANSADLLSCKVIIEYSPDDGSTFMGTVTASGGGAPESIVPAAFYEPTGGAASTIIGYGAYVVPTLNMTAPTAGNTRSNKIRVKVQNNSANALTLDKFSIYKYN